MNWRAVLRPICRWRGHYNVGTALPEDPFGYGAFSKLWCRRCGQVDLEYPLRDQIGVLMGYVTLWNDVRPVVDAARWVTESTFESGPHIETLVAAVKKYEALYPEHVP